MQCATNLRHPFASAGALHPLYDRALFAVTADTVDIRKLVMERTAVWCKVAEEGERHRQEWLSSLPEHARSLYSSTGLNGPALKIMHEHLVARGYPDKSLSRDIAAGFPCGILEPSGLWPP
jgi:hypothetical protein